MAPEVLAGEPASVQSDVYSIGVLLYRLVTSEYPVDGRTMEDLHEAHVQGRRRLLSERRPDLPLRFIQSTPRILAQFQVISQIDRDFTHGRYNRRPAETALKTSRRIRTERPSTAGSWA